MKLEPWDEAVEGAVKDFIYDLDDSFRSAMKSLWGGSSSPSNPPPSNPSPEPRSGGGGHSSGGQQGGSSGGCSCSWFCRCR